MEDDPDTLEVTTLFLEKNGWEVHTARDGREALRIYHQITGSVFFDAILLDVQIPGMNGFAVGVNIRNVETWAENVPRARHVYVTGHRSPVPPEQLKAAMVANGPFMDTFLVKPVIPEEMLKALSGE